MDILFIISFVLSGCKNTNFVFLVWVYTTSPLSFGRGLHPIAAFFRQGFTPPAYNSAAPTGLILM